MGMNELTHEAISLALTNDDPLTHNQRASLLSLVADDKVWQREYDKVSAELNAAKVELERQRSLLRRQYEADAALYKESCDWASRNVELAEHDAIHSILAAEFGGNREVVLAHEMQIKDHDRDQPPTEAIAEVPWSMVQSLCMVALADPTEAMEHQVQRLATHFGMGDKRGQSLAAMLLRLRQRREMPHVIAGPSRLVNASQTFNGDEPTEPSAEVVLPEPHVGSVLGYYTADQMRAYGDARASAAILADRAAWPDMIRQALLDTAEEGDGEYASQEADRITERILQGLNVEARHGITPTAPTQTTHTKE